MQVRTDDKNTPIVIQFYPPFRPLIDLPFMTPNHLSSTQSKSPICVPQLSLRAFEQPSEFNIEVTSE